MNMEITLEQLMKIKEAKTPEELLALAKAEGVPLTEAEANEYFTRLNPPAGELTDQELEDVSGGGCGGGDAQSPKMRIIGKKLGCRCSQCGYDCWAPNTAKWFTSSTWDCCVCKAQGKSSVPTVEIPGRVETFDKVDLWV